MDRGELERAFGAFDPEVPVEEAWMPPSAWYVDPAIFALELDAVFRRSWQMVARADQLARPGRFVATRAGREPVVVVRGGDGVLRALSNVCRHHAAEVATGEGRADAFTCPYHAWRYDLDGRLASAPRMSGVRGFEREGLRLPSLAVEEVGPFVFANADPDAEPIAPALELLMDRLEAMGLATLRFLERRVYEVECNWKVYVDNYLDGGYHVAHLHRGLGGQLDLDAYAIELFERFSIQSCPGGAELATRDALDSPERIGEAALYAWVWPNFMLNRYGPFLDTNLVVPVSPERTRVVFDYWIDRSGSSLGREFLHRSLAASDRVQREDELICASVQRGLASAAYDRGRYAPRVEAGEHHFHVLLHRALRGALADAPTGGAREGGPAR